MWREPKQDTTSSAALSIITLRHNDYAVLWIQFVICAAILQVCTHTVNTHFPTGHDEP